MTSFEIVITVAIVVAGTLLTRFSAFLIFPPGKKAPDFVQYLGKALPAAVMGMLVVYFWEICFVRVQVTVDSYAALFVGSVRWFEGTGYKLSGDRTSGVQCR